MKKQLLILLLSTAIAGLTSCNRVPNYIENPVTRNLSNQQINDLYTIQHTGIQVVKQGMKFTFIIPVDCFFVKQTRALKSYREKDLTVLSRFIRSYVRYFARAKISVLGYTDTVLLSPARDQLSLHYAETIASSLQENGVPSEEFVIRGNGASGAVASNESPLGSSFNRRVEVVVSN